MCKAENQRISFIVHRDGPAVALEWARRTMNIYRHCVLSDGTGNRKFHIGSTLSHRLLFIKSYLELKRYVMENQA